MTDQRTPEIAETIYRLDGPLRWALGEVTDLLRAVQIRSGASVLDLGAGTGYASIPAARAVGPDGHVHCLDASPQLLQVLDARARRAGVRERLSLHTGSATRIPLADSSVDLAITTYVLHELADQAPAALAELHRVLRPTGQVLIADYRRTSDREHNQEIEAWYARQPDGAGVDEVHLRFRLEDVEQMLRTAGFVHVQLATWHDFHVHALATKP